MIQNYGVYLLPSGFLESLKTNKTWQKRSLILQHRNLLKKPLLYYVSQLTQYYKKFTPATQPKTHALYKFTSKHVPGWCHLHHF